MLFCVWDGHGGKEVAEFARERFKEVFTKQPEFKAGKFKEALINAFVEFDSEVEDKEYGNDTGCTSNVVYVSRDEIYCANVGDSRAVLFTNEKAFPLSEDHKPDNAEELKRIKNAGHFVEDSRVDGNLALSRAFGDFQYKDQSNLQPKEQAVSCFPDVTVTKRKPGDKFIIIACDGIWDCVSNDEACEKINKYYI
jgi:serine/threonine protein phosphatase PrpC